MLYQCQYLQSLGKDEFPVQPRDSRQGEFLLREKVTLAGYLQKRFEFSFCLPRLRRIGGARPDDSLHCRGLAGEGTSWVVVPLNVLRRSALSVGRFATPESRDSPRAGYRARGILS